MDKLMKLNKSELIKQVREFSGDLQNAKNGWDSTHKQFEAARNSLEDERKKCQNLDNKLSDIRKAIETVLKMKYSHLRFPINFEAARNSLENGWDSTHKQAEASPQTKTGTDVEVPVNEELNLLLHLQDLAQVGMTHVAMSQSDTCRPY